MIQAVFFDIDGTLLSHRSCTVPASTQKALAKLGDCHRPPFKGYTREETAAFGDGENDREMLRYVHKGIAMANASGSVKAAADYVTTDVDEDGIQNGLHYMGLV